MKEVLRWIKAQHPHLTEDGLSMRVLIINGHPDPKASHLCDALADAYADGARAAGHEVARIDVRALDFPLLRSRHEWESEPLPPSLQAAQNAIGHAQHLMVVFPLWLGDMPAFFYRLYYRAHSLRLLRRNVFGLVGIKTVGDAVVGSVETGVALRFVRHPRTSAGLAMHQRFFVATRRQHHIARGTTVCHASAKA